MNILFNLLFLFVYIFISLIIGVPGTGNNILKNKLFLFCGIFLYQFIVEFMVKFSKNESIVFNNILKKSLYNAGISIFGYSIYIDLITMKYLTKIDNTFTKSAVISCIIILSIGLSKVFEIIIFNDF